MWWSEVWRGPTAKLTSAGPLLLCATRVDVEAWLHLVRPVSRVACNSKQLRNGIRHGFEIYLTSTVAVALVPMNAGEQWGGK